MRKEGCSTAGRKAGRPLKEIKKIEFEKLCALQCTQQEICDFFECDHKTLTRWCKRTYGQDYSQVYAQKRSGGKISLRRMQFKLAEKSAAMAIFLGKNILGQSDYPDNGGSDEAVEKANAQVHALADLINNPVENLTIEEVEADEEEGAVE